MAATRDEERYVAEVVGWRNALHTRDELAEKLRLESELARLQNHSTAVAADDDAIAAPSAADVARVKALADQVDGLTVTANTYAKAVDAADEALKTYNKVRG